MTETVSVGDALVCGVGVDSETRCTHYGSERDVVALAFPCCEAFYPCRECHDAVTDHDTERWGRDELDAEAVLCGACGTRLSLRAFVAQEESREPQCPGCAHPFNPGCLGHLNRYLSRR